MATLVGQNELLLEGFNDGCNAVKRTLGAEGKLAVLEAEQVGKPPQATKDGVSVVKHLTENNPVKFQGLVLAKQAAMKTLVEVGDNTTTTLVLAQSLVEEVGTSFNKKMEFGIEEAHNDAQRYLKKFAKKANKKTVRDIATVSANNDKKIGDIVAKAYEASNNGEGIIDHVPNMKQRDVTLRISEGLKVDKGWTSAGLINNEQKGIFEAENVQVVVYEGWESEKSEPLRKLLQENLNKNIPTLIIVERVGDSSLIDKLTISVRAGKSVMIVEAPGFDEERLQIMNDIALYTGGKVFRQGQEAPIEAGFAEKVTVGLNSTNIITPKSEAVDKKLKELRELLANDEVEKDENLLKQRIKALEGKSVTVVVGGDLEMGASEVFDRVDDAIKAVKSVLNEGWVAGGGSTLAHISNLMNRTFDNKDKQAGYDAFKRSLLSPMKQICINARRDPKEHLEKAFQKYGWGYNGTTDETSNLIKDSIIDSKKGISVALRNAKATAILLLNIDVISTISRAE